MSIEEYYTKETVEQVNKALDNILDHIEQLSQYITWSVRLKYLIELRICWDLQGFDDEDSWMKLLDISFDLTKQEFADTQRWIDRYRRSKDYEGDMAEFEV